MIGSGLHTKTVTGKERGRWDVCTVRHDVYDKNRPLLLRVRFPLINKKTSRKLFHLTAHEVSNRILTSCQPGTVTGGRDKYSKDRQRDKQTDNTIQYHFIDPLREIASVLAGVHTYFIKLETIHIQSNSHIH